MGEIKGTTRGQECLPWGSYTSIDLEGSALDRPCLSLSDRRWGVIIGQPMRNMLSQMFQQHINSSMRINSSITYVRMLGQKQSTDYKQSLDAAPTRRAVKHAANLSQLSLRKCTQGYRAELC